MLALEDKAQVKKWKFLNVFNYLAKGKHWEAHLVCRLTCDDTGEGTVHCHGGEGSGGATKGRHH